MRSWAVVAALLAVLGSRTVCAGAPDGVLEQASAALQEGEKGQAIVALDEHLASHPGDCEARSWLAWIYIDSGFKELTRELLDHPSCEEVSDELRLRLQLFELYMRLLEGEATASELDSLPVPAIHGEDLLLYRYLRAKLMPHLTPPLILRATLLGGYTTNALFGSPHDPVNRGKETASPVFSHDVSVGIEPRVTPWLAPSLQLSTRSAVFFTHDTEEFTSFDLGVRAGLRFMKPHGSLPGLLVAYRGEMLFLDMEDRYDSTAPLVFYEGHRMELELHVTPSILMFGGWGRRFFREDIRTRFELDGGLGLHRRVLPWLSLLAAFSVRHHWAMEKAYDLVGASVVLAASVQIFRGMKFKTRVSLFMDHYDASRGYFDPVLGRRDTTLKVRAEFLTMSLAGVRFTMSYEFSDRFSSVPDYAFVDHRVMAGVTAYYGFDFLGLKKSKTPHVPLVYDLQLGGGDDPEGIQDLLKASEDIQGGPSCGCTE